MVKLYTRFKNIRIHFSYRRLLIICFIILTVYAILLIYLLKEVKPNEKHENERHHTRMNAGQAVIYELPDKLNIQKGNNLLSEVYEYISGVKEDIISTNHSTDIGYYWETASMWVTPRHIHPLRIPELGIILRAMANGTIRKADTGFKGTQLKATFQLDSHQIAVFKPKWYERDYIINGKPYDGKDRHNGEVAGYYLGRLLKFNRSPLVAGRKVHLKSEVIPVASKRLKSTFLFKDNNLCFYGVCHYCSPSDPVCGEGDDGELEGVIILWLPPGYVPQRVVSPWIRKYKTNQSAVWEKDNSYCKSVVLKNPVYNQGPRLLDLIETSIFDFLIGNADRHHYEVFKDIPNSTVLLLDNGKSFGNPFHDEISILAPLYQCCRLRNHVFHWLVKFTKTSLGRALDEVMKHDAIYPVLTSHHLTAIDRRLTRVIEEIWRCIEKNGESQVLMEDGFD